MAVLVGLSALLLVEVTPWTLLLVMPLVGGLVLLYRRFAAVSREGQDLEKVYAFARQVEQISPDEDGPRRTCGRGGRGRPRAA
jgi:hypothetical protein